MPIPHPTRAIFLAPAVAATMLALVAPAATAKETTSGGGGTTTTTTCSPVSSLKAQGDPSNGELGMATIDVDYSVKPCSSKQVVTVETTVAEYFDPSAVVWDDPAAPESGKFTVYGVKLRTTYVVTVTVLDAATGAVVGSATKSAAATPKGGV